MDLGVLVIRLDVCVLKVHCVCMRVSVLGSFTQAASLMEVEQRWPGIRESILPPSECCFLTAENEFVCQYWDTSASQDVFPPS